MKIPFIDLNAQYKKIESKVNSAIDNVLKHGIFINGPEVKEFESNLSDYTSVKHSITCANGTDALTIALMALDVKPNDAVFVPSFTYIASVESIALVGGTPYFIDVSDDYNLCCKSFEIALLDAKKNGHTPKIVIPVDLFGKPSVSAELDKIIHSNGLKCIYDAAQSFGSSHKGKKIGNFGDITTTSFFPAKPLGCYGDGGAIFTNCEHLQKKIRSIKNHGMGSHKYEHVNIGLNSRLDTIQAAILIEKIKLLKDEIIKRNQIAKIYNSEFEGYDLYLPYLSKEQCFAWAQYTLRHKKRDKLLTKLNSEGIPTAIYYPIPLNQQEAYKHCNVVSAGIPNTEKFCKEVFSLPMSPYLTESQQAYIIDKMKKNVKKV